MALIIPPGFMQVVFRHEFTGDDEEMFCTFGFDLGDWSGTNEEAVTFVSQRWGDWVLGFCSNQLVHTYATGYIGQDGADPLVVDGVPQDAVGGDSSETLPPNCAYLVRKKTGLGGRRGRGRFYVPCPDETQVDRNGAIAGAWLTAIQTNLDDMMEAWGTTAGLGFVTPVILHRSEGEGIEPAPTVVTLLEVDGHIATQRRRLRP